MAKFIWPDDAFIATFAFLLLKSAFFQGALAGASRSAQAGFNKGDLAAIHFPLPPLAEQRRIVAKVDDLMALGATACKMSLTVGDETRNLLLDTLIAKALTPADRDVEALVRLLARCAGYSFPAHSHREA